MSNLNAVLLKTTEHNLCNKHTDYICVFFVYLKSPHTPKITAPADH